MTEQKHMSGERYLQQAVTTTSGKKLIITGLSNDGTRVVFKATRDAGGIREIEHERTCRNVLARIDFAGSVFHTPEEVGYIQENGFVIAIQRFIEQPSSFLERPVEEQFALALRAFKAQESAHATTSKHRALITSIYGMRDARSYLHSFQTFCANITITRPHDAPLHTLLEAALGTAERA